MIESKESPKLVERMTLNGQSRDGDYLSPTRPTSRSFVTEPFGVLFSPKYQGLKKESGDDEGGGK
jgi:hypothetical protein